MAAIFIDFYHSVPTKDSRRLQPQRSFPPPYSLPRWTDVDPSDDRKSFSITDATKIHGYSSPVVYRGALCTGGDSPVDVVVKLVYGKNSADGLVKEAGFYTNEGRHLQGSAIPRFRGLFRGQTVDGIVTCMVLDYCGESLKNSFRHKDIDFRLDIIERLVDLHYAGLLHGDMRESNVLDNQGAPILIDLEHAQPHVCNRKMPVDVGALCPIREEFGCWEIYDLALEMGVWYTGMVDYFGRSIILGTVKSAEELTKMAPARYHKTEEGRAEAMRRAEAAWNELQLMRDGIITYSSDD